MDQYVIVAAGLDTFALRRPELLKSVSGFFELDQPATQAWKRRRFAELGLGRATGLHFVPADLAKESVSAALARGSFDPKAPALFSWLGVACYLERDALLRTMRPTGLDRLRPLGHSRALCSRSISVGLRACSARNQDQKAKLRAVLGMDSPQPGHPDKPARGRRTPEPGGEGPPPSAPG